MNIWAIRCLHPSSVCFYLLAWYEIDLWPSTAADYKNGATFYRWSPWHYWVDTLSVFIFLLLCICLVQLLFFGHRQSPWERGDGRLQWQVATISELTCFLWLCLSERHHPKKDAASQGAHSAAFPSDPSLKAWKQQLGRLEVRGHWLTHPLTDHTHTHTHCACSLTAVDSQERFASDKSGLSAPQLDQVLFKDRSVWGVFGGTYCMSLVPWDFLCLWAPDPRTLFLTPPVHMQLRSWSIWPFKLSRHTLRFRPFNHELLRVQTGVK